MNYLSFDIEAANGFKPYSICSIGIIIADEQFNILHQENVWINPKVKYNLNGTRKNVGIDLHLDKALLDSSPDFVHAYDRIKGYLTADDTVVLGHAVESDVYMLNAACKRHHLPCIDFKFICSQLLYRLYNGEKEVKALSKIADNLSIVFSPHNSQDDALVSMLTLKYLLADSGMTLSQFLEKYAVRIGENKNFELTRTVSLLQATSSKAAVKAKINQIYTYVSMANFARVSSKLDGRIFTLARSIELADFDTATRPVIDVIYRNGGKYTSRLSKCNYYISNPTEQVLTQDKTRETKVAERVEKGEITQITLAQLFEQLGEGK